MADGYDNNMTGMISGNKKKTKDTSPDYLGKCEIDRVPYFIAGWVKERKDGSGKFLSLAFKPVDEQQQSSASTPQAKQLAEDDEVPF